MEVINDALKYVVQAKEILFHEQLRAEIDFDTADEVINLLEKAEEALVKAK